MFLHPISVGYFLCLNFLRLFCACSTGILLNYFWDFLRSSILIDSSLCFWNLWLTTGLYLITSLNCLYAYVSCSRYQLKFTFGYMQFLWWIMPSYFDINNRESSYEEFSWPCRLKHSFLLSETLTEG